MQMHIFSVKYLKGKRFIKKEKLYKSVSAVDGLRLLILE